MLFNSYAFLLGFLPAAIIGYWLLLRHAGVGASIIWLAALSFFFYVSGETTYPWLILLSVAVNYTAGFLIGRTAGTTRKAMLTGGLAIDLGLLAYFKYSNFGIGQLQALHLIGPQQWNVLLPIGISFYTFTQIAFLVDVYQRKARELQPIPYFLFVSYFPHLIAGPILHHAEMLPQFRNPARCSATATLFPGLAMLAIGLAKKVLIADSCASIASGIFDGPTAASHGAIVAWIGALAYTMQIYFDFSGYSDMAIGASKLLGIDLPINFNSPYKSRSIIEFWRRWHITLSRFLRDYLYIPLGGNRKGRGRRYINLFLTMLLGGAWHGAGWNFIVWGALHGAAQSLAHGWNDLGRTRRLPTIPPALGWLVTTLFVIAAWVPFRVHSLPAALQMWTGMAGLHGLGAPALGQLQRFAPILGVLEPVDFGGYALAIIPLALLLAVLAPNSQQLLGRFSVGLDSPGYAAHGRPARLASAPTGPGRPQSACCSACRCAASAATASSSTSTSHPGLLEFGVPERTHLQ